MSESPTVLSSLTDKFHDLIDSSHSEVKQEPPKQEGSSNSEVKDEPSKPVKKRLFNRERSLHAIFGGGKAADAFLWRHKITSGAILGIATIAYYLLEHSGYSLLTIISNILLLAFGVLFLWSNAAVFLNRSPPPLPNLEISEKVANSLALALREEINKALVIAHDIALGKDLKKFLKVVAVLWGLSIVGGWFHFLTLVYLVIVVAHTIPVVYETYEEQIETYAKYGFEAAQTHYKKVDETFFSKVFKNFPKLKKTE